MAATAPQPEVPSTSHQLTLALLGGLTLASVLFAHIATVQTPGLDPPPESAALFVVAATAAAVGYLLVSQESRLGYPAGVLAGLVTLGAVGTILTGVYGAAGPETNPVGPVVYVLLAAGVALASLVAWRGGSRSASSRGSGSPR